MSDMAKATFSDIVAVIKNRIDIKIYLGLNRILFAIYTHNGSKSD